MVTKSLLTALTLALTASSATLTFQNGTGGYDGCTDAFIYKRHANSTYVESRDEIAQGARTMLILEEDQA